MAIEWQRVLRWMQRRVTLHDDAMRVDRWLRSQFPHVPHSYLQRQLRQRKIRLLPLDGDGSVPAKAHALLHAGTVVAIDAVVFDSALRTDPRDVEDVEYSLQPGMQDTVAQLVERVVYKDDNYLVLNKPPGLAVQDGTAQLHSLATFLPAMGAALNSDTPRLVHRLDKDTSGLLVLARHRLAAARFSEILRGGGVKKTYDALVLPHRNAPDIPDKGEIAIPIDGKPARSLFRRLHNDESHRHALWLEMQPVTGRKHQLRIHCAVGLQSPIVGDRKYGSVGRRADAQPAERLFLHARRLRFPDPFRSSHTIDVACEMDKLRIDTAHHEKKTTEEKATEKSAKS